jgi:predicted nucleic acid-binding protein
LKELAVGLHHVEDDPNLADLTVDFAWLDVLPFTVNHAFHAGYIEAYSTEQGLPREKINSLGGDILIGGVAVAEDASVVTEHVDEFHLMPDVSVEAY